MAFAQASVMGVVNTVPHATLLNAHRHTVQNNVKAAYHRTDLLEQRKPMMKAWADVVTRKPETMEFQARAAGCKTVSTTALGFAALMTESVSSIGRTV